MPRIFIAIDLPQTVKNQLYDLSIDDIPMARWVRPHRLHLTLRFLGETDEPTFQKVRDALANVEAKAFKLEISGLGKFPVDSPGIRALWARVQNTPELRQLHQQVAAVLQPVGFEPEAKRYIPHITLARFRHTPRWGLVSKYMQEHANFYVEPFNVTEFVLFSSDLDGKGPAYTPEQTYLLP